MSDFTVLLPKLGESILSATVIKWFKKEGDIISLDEPLLEVATDKVNSEIPSPVSGKILKILAKIDEEKNVGDPLVLIATDVELVQEETKQTYSSPEKTSIEDQTLISPAVLKLMQEHNLTFDDIQKIPRSSKSGRLSKKDLLNFLEISETSEDHIKMSAMRKAIAENMVRSFYEAPHASLIHEIDVTGPVEFIKREKESFKEKHATKITITSFVALAIAKAMKKFPLLNSTLKEDTIILKKDINLGIAVSVENGIMVPVIRNASSKDLISMNKAIADIASRVRSNTLNPDDVREGTVTMTNFGMGGVMIGIPIIRYPEMAIVGIGSLKKKPVVVDDDKIAIRTMMHLCLTFDHRVIDGMYGCAFLQEVEAALNEIPLIL